MAPLHTAGATYVRPPGVIVYTRHGHEVAHVTAGLARKPDEAGDPSELMRARDKVHVGSKPSSKSSRPHPPSPAIAARLPLPRRHTSAVAAVALPAIRP
jgi:hypothetical protein